MKRVLALTALLALAACEAPKSRPDTAGQASRGEVDTATKTYGECISTKADTLPVKDEAAGSLALDILKMCKPERDDLTTKVAAFHKLGNPKESDARADAVAEASVLSVDDEARRAAVVTIIKRQGLSPGASNGTSK